MRTIIEIPIEYDEVKFTKNLFKHKLNFNIAQRFQHDTLMVKLDKRKEYGEARKIGIGMIDNTLYCVVYVKRKTKYRIISLRLANKVERDLYEKFNN